MEGLIYGQDVFFLGFPYDLLGRIILGSEGYPLPFVKKATVSLFDSRVIYLDGHNNSGFSGGPVVFPQTGKNEYRVAGVVSGYVERPEPVFDGEHKTPLVYQYNTGIIVAHNIKAALDLITLNPIGCALGDSG